MTAMMMLDDVSPLERIKLSGQLAAQVAAAATATGMERVRVAGSIAAILAKLGATQAAPARIKLTTQKLHAVIQAGVGVKSSKYAPSQRIDRTTYDVHTKIKGVYGVVSSQHIEEIAAALSAAGIEFDGSDIARGFVKVPVWQRQATDPARTDAPVPFATFEPKADGSLIVRGDAEALTAAIKAIGGKPKAVAGGVRLTAGEARLRQYIPVRIERLPSGAQLEYSENGAVGVRGDFRGGYMGAAAKLSELELYFTQDYGPKEFERVFGKPAPAEGIALYEQDQAEIAERVAENKARTDEQRIDYAKKSGNWAQLSDDEKTALKAEADALTAEFEQKQQADWEATTGAGVSSNQRYQAYLDTLEDIPATGRIMVQVGYMGWIQQRLTEYKATGVEPMPYTNGAAQDEWQRKATAFVREWADQHLSARVKAHRAAGTLSPVSEAELIDVGLLRKWGDQWKYRHSMESPSYFTANTKESAIERATAAYWKATPEQRLTSEQRFEKANQDDIASSDDMWRHMDMDALAAMYEKMGGDIKGLQAAGAREFTDGGRRTAPAVAAEGARETAEMRRKLGRYIEWRNEQSAAGDEPEKAPAAEPEAPAFEIIEHTTGRGKVIRGIVRTDLSYADAKGIDEYTFKKDGGYFIREKHLESMGLPPAPTAPAEPVDPIRQAELDAEREQLRLQAEADRLANEQARQRQKLEQQVSKLRSVAASTLEKAEQELGRDRLANTSRRAAMAASGIATAERSRALALTMNNLADAIERGQAQHLAGISSRADVETLTNSLVNARANYERAKGMSYGDQQKRKHDPITVEEARYAEMPRPRWDNAGASRAKVLDLIKGKRGAPALSKKIMYATFIEPEDVKALRAMVGQKEADAELGWYNVETLTKVERLKRAGITSNQELRDALVEFLEFRTGARAEDPIAKAERAIIGQKVGIDFFPTPKALAARMASLAGVSEGDRVLEPSAGNGNLADAAKAAGGQVDVIEISSQLRDILTAKGYEVVAHDFDAFTPSEPYDAVIMNPPFGKGTARLDAQHLMRAFGMLKPGGKLVGIAGEGVFFGTDAKAVAFRKWLDDHGADIEPLGAGTFKDTQLLATTGANARLIVMRK